MKANFRVLAFSVFVLSATSFSPVGRTDFFGEANPDFTDGVATTTSIQTMKGDSCEGHWESVKAKIPDSKVKLKLTSTKEGQPMLKWSGRAGTVANLYIHKARGPVNSQGEIEMCTPEATMSIYDDSYSLKELKQDQKLPPGYYAVRVTFHSGNVSNESSDWIVIRIK